MAENYKVSYKSTDKNSSTLLIHTTGYQKCVPSHQWGPGIRDHFLLHYIISGSGFLSLDGKTHEIEEGDSFLIPPFSEATYYAAGENPWEYIWVGFTGDDAKKITQSIGFTLSTPVLYSPDNKEAIFHHLQQLYDARGSELQNTIEMTGRLYTLLSQLLLSDWSITSQQVENKENTILNATHQSNRLSTYETYTNRGMEYIHANYSYPITVVDIADYVGISRSHLFRAFQETNRQSPKEYLTKFRIHQACILLEHSDLSVTAIGRSVGFEDNLNFSKAFKKITGIAPSFYNTCDCNSQLL